MQLLHQEIQTLARAAARREHSTNLGQMGTEPRQLFRHVDLAREKRQLLLQPLSFGVEPGLPQSRAELFGKSCLKRRNPGPDARDLALDGVATFEQHRREFCAFALTRGGELGDCLPQESMSVRSELFRRNGGLGQDPRPAQDFARLTWALRRGRP